MQLYLEIYVKLFKFKKIRQSRASDGESNKTIPELPRKGMEQRATKTFIAEKRLKY